MSKRGPYDLTKDQRDGVSALCKTPFAYVEAPVGSGKTVVGLTYIEARRKITGRKFKTLLVAPLRVARANWIEEPGHWSHLDHLKVHPMKSPYTVSPEALKADVWTLSYESLSGFFNRHRDLKKLGFEVCILDEVHKMKDPTSVRYAGVWRGRNPNRKMLKPGFRDMRDQFQSIIGLTGTPVPHNFLDVWAQVSSIAGEDKLFGSFDNWKQHRFYMPPADAHKPAFAQRYLPRDWTRVLDDFSDITIHIGVEEGAVPDAVELDPIMVEPEPHVMDMYKDLVREEYLRIKDKEITVANAAVLYGKLRQFTSGYLYDPDKQSVFVHPTKYDIAARIYEQAKSKGKKVIFVYAFQSQRNALADMFPHAVDLATSEDVNASIHRWNTDPAADVLTMHPRSAGEGINLQFSGCKTIIFLSEPESIGSMRQTVGRLARRQATEEPVKYTAVRIKGTVDEIVSKRLNSMKDVLDAVINHVKEGSNADT